MRIGIDLGGTKIEGIALSAQGEQLWRERIATPKGDYQATINAITDLVARIESDLGESGSVGIGTPGAISPHTRLMKNCNSTVLNGQAFKEDLSAALKRPVAMANDADCFTLSEAIDGAASGAGTVFGVILGTGVGGGVVISRQLLAGPNAIAGEWGHNPLPVQFGSGHIPRHCYCGRKDCIETWLSGPGIEHSYFSRTGQQVSAVHLSEKVDAGDAVATDILSEYVDSLARALATVINVLDPEVVVLGGGMSNVASLYDTVPARWGDYVFSDVVSTRLVQATHGDSSGVRGAAWLWPAN